MSSFKVDEQLTRLVISKRAQSIPLTDIEENYARKLFDHLLTSKKSVQKTVRIVTGAELRKEKGNDLQKQLGAEATRPYNHPRQVGERPEHDNPNAQPDESLKGGEKLPDVDNKDARVQTENQRLSDILQENQDTPTTQGKAPIQVEPAAKFEALDPAKVGDTVLKNFARVGTLIIKGKVLNINTHGVATVKWADGRQTFENAAQLVKAKTAASASEVKTEPEMTRDIPVKKGAVTHTEAHQEVKDKPGVEDPHALAQHIVEQADGEKEKVKKDGDIVESPEMAMPSPQPVPYSDTPFEGLVGSLQGVLNLARQIKDCQERHKTDEEVHNYYGEILEALREIAETTLAALSMELTEAQEDAKE